jgi:hypothetical protein
MGNLGNEARLESDQDIPNLTIERSSCGGEMAAPKNRGLCRKCRAQFDSRIASTILPGGQCTIVKFPYLSHAKSTWYPSETLDTRSGEDQTTRDRHRECLPSLFLYVKPFDP